MNDVAKRIVLGNSALGICGRRQRAGAGGASAAGWPRRAPANPPMVLSTPAFPMAQSFQIATRRYSKLSAVSLPR